MYMYVTVDFKRETVKECAMKEGYRKKVCPVRF